MPLQFSTTLRNATLDAFQYRAQLGQTTGIGPSAIIKFFTGSMPANCAAPDTGTKIAEFDLGPSWAAAASAGAKSLSSLPLTVPAIAAGIIRFFRLEARRAGVVARSGDLEGCLGPLKEKAPTCMRLRATVGRSKHCPIVQDTL